MSAAPNGLPRRVLQLYYAATIVFLVLDYGFGVNVRIAGLQGFPALKAGYYLVIFACLGLVLWRPAWSTRPARRHSGCSRRCARLLKREYRWSGSSRHASTDYGTNFN